MISKDNSNITVVKASGEKELFSAKKLERSLRNVHAGEDIIKEITYDIKNWIYTGVTTNKIYSRAFSLLRRKKTAAALRYRLKQAILELGPTGYPFEYLIGQIFKRRGYAVSIGIVMEGLCVSHEVDVVSTNKKNQNFIECKYSTSQGKQINIQVPLYVRSRVDDIVNRRKDMPEYAGFSFFGWVATNMRFSPDSKKYGKCCGLQLLSWDYPEYNSLQNNIEREKLYPVTILNHLQKSQKQFLLNEGIVVCSQIPDNPNTIASFRLNRLKYSALMKEIEVICK